MRWFIGLAGAFMSFAAYAATQPAPTEFQGRWRVAWMVGASDIGTIADFHKLLGTTVEWTATTVKDADGTCQLPHAGVSPVKRNELEHDLRGGQTIAGLMLSRTDVARTFGKPETPVFDDGGRDCARAVMLDRDRLLLMFENGYLYVLTRISAR
jgi:hypothetical protein